MTLRDAAQRPQSAQVTSPLWAGQTTTFLPAGVRTVWGLSLGRTTTTGPQSTSASSSASARVSADRLTRKPLLFAYRTAAALPTACGEFPTTGLWVYVQPRLPWLARTNWASMRASMSSPSPGRSPAWLCLHKLPGAMLSIRIRKSNHGTPRLPSDTLRQCQARGPAEA